MTTLSPPDPYRPRPQCERRIWMKGVERRCGMEIGVTTWQDHTGRQHTACRAHLQELRNRWVETLPELPEPTWLHEDPDFIDHAPDATPESEWAAWTEGEKVAGFGK